MAPRKVIICTDPGQDQAGAILLMLGMPEAFEVLGLVATAGNIHLPYTIQNALKLMELAGRPDIPVFAGTESPMVHDLVIADHVHGPTGMDGPTLPEPKIKAQDKRGADFIIDTLRSEPPKTVSIMVLSPMTNLGLALLLAPDVAPRIQEVVAMCGAYFEGGNITPTAEFNCYVDPEAATRVLESGIPLTLLPLDVTHQMLSTPERLKAMRDIGTKCAVGLQEMMSFSEPFDLKKYEWRGAPFHAPCVPLFVIDPGMFQGRQISVIVDTRPGPTRGMTIADYWRITDRPKNVFWVRSGDSDKFYDILNKAMINLP